MFEIAITLAIVFILLIIAELMWRVWLIHTELTRKFVHISVGTFVAFWPFFLTWTQIEILAVAFFVVILLSRLMTIFSSIHLIGRKTVGELMFALSIGLTALVTHNDWIFMTAMLHLSLADGLAAVVGSKFGKKHKYTVFGQEKTMVGTVTFWTCSLLILGAFFIISGLNPWPKLLLLPFATTLIENIGVRGTDNLLVPLLVAFSLQRF